MGHIGYQFNAEMLTFHPFINCILKSGVDIINIVGKLFEIAEHILCVNFML